MTRRDEILKLIVEHFIKTAEPVGSKTLQEAFHLNVSSATIRNEMNALEKDGYLEKTHTSSGRIPSEKGYQYYVDNLRSGGVDERAKNALQTILSEKAKSIEEVMKESCQILSQMTNLASCVIGQKADEERLMSIQIIPLAENTATAIFVTDKGHVESKTFLVDNAVKVEDVAKTVKLLNERLSGTPIVSVVPRMEAMRPALTDYLLGQRLVFDAVLSAFASLASRHLEFFGKDELYSQPEFANDAYKLRELLKFLDDPKELKDALAKAKEESGHDDLVVQIGGNANAPGDLALVSAKINIPGEEGSALTVLGPSRMDYDRVVSTLQYFAKELDRYFNGGKKGEKACSIKPKSKSKAKKSNPKAKTK